MAIQRRETGDSGGFTYGESEQHPQKPTLVDIEDMTERFGSYIMVCLQARDQPVERLRRAVEQMDRDLAGFHKKINALENARQHILNIIKEKS